MAQMANLNEILRGHFLESAALKTQMAQTLAMPLQDASALLVVALKNGNKVLACGNGGSAADSQHFAAELVGRFEKERVALPAIALTTDSSILTAVANDYAFEDVFARQVLALGNSGDVLLAISTSGNSNNVLNAIEAAHTKNINVIALTGKNGGKIAEVLTKKDILLNVSHSRTARIQEVHLTIIHALCDSVDLSF